MPKVIGPIKFTGNIHDLCFYKMNGEYYVRMKSSLLSKRVKKSPRFKLTMAYAGLLAQASKLASLIYKEFPAEMKGKGVFKRLVGDVFRLLKAGRPEEEIRFILSPIADVEEEGSNKPSTNFADEVLKEVFGEREIIYEGLIEKNEEWIMDSG
ncbi:MAG: hypothetical protein JSU05_02845 [Bacteroidetes bacterium]|nr:hypothetical protein [Bacteroidota bacterium]